MKLALCFETANFSHLSFEPERKNAVTFAHALKVIVQLLLELVWDVIGSQLANREARRKHQAHRRQTSRIRNFSALITVVAELIFLADGYL